MDGRVEGRDDGGGDGQEVGWDGAQTDIMGLCLVWCCAIARSVLLCYCTIVLLYWYCAICSVQYLGDC